MIAFHHNLDGTGRHLILAQLDARYSIQALPTLGEPERKGSPLTPNRSLHRLEKHGVALEIAGR
jgi:hypothetical protein